ncbi:peptide ABC transporter substrate-binding protein [Paenibacillus woosongensis]|uniref:Peptide ABC transporter substrate-binding protein n=1 Tax=Paenibacillus woosongensis TaxID=307580 RepID=A0AA95IAT9_9BACL|nr:peptide ABC transporter substrate-binding protein [Paenibacillus woosongensis]WHX49682.1 peptide ABC transporter substrate-binding protein [Paenibacillus woosongensis]
MMPIDEALNADMKYIAIDFSVLTHLAAEDKQYIEEYIGSRFAAPVRDATFEQLKESEGDDFTDNGMVLSGVLLQIDKVEISEHGAVIEGMKYRSGNGAVGIAIQLELKDGAWKVIEAANNWIS